MHTWDCEIGRARALTNTLTKKKPVYKKNFRWSFWEKRNWNNKQEKNIRTKINGKKATTIKLQEKIQFFFGSNNANSIVNTVKYCASDSSFILLVHFDSVCCSISLVRASENRNRYIYNWYNQFEIVPNAWVRWKCWTLTIPITTIVYYDLV